MFMMSEVLFENEDLKLVESVNNYVLVTDKKIRCVYDGECKIDRVCVVK